MTKKLLLIPILIALFLVFRQGSNKPATPGAQPVVNTPLSESRPYCFTYTHTATTDEPYAVEEHMKLTRVRGDVTGTKSGTQTGPDMSNGYEGTLAGGMVDDALELVFDYTVEGSNNRELEIYKMDGNDLIKQRWALTESKRDGKSILIPDRIGEPVGMTYKAEACTD